MINKIVNKTRNNDPVKGIALAARQQINSRGQGNG
jgi:hypothetical protein